MANVVSRNGDFGYERITKEYENLIIKVGIDTASSRLNGSMSTHKVAKYGVPSAAMIPARDT